MTAPPARYDHVVWIVMENHSYDQIIGSSDAPYINRLAGEHGLAVNFYAESHPSLPNYIAMTSGSTQGIADDDDPPAHPLDVPSLFSLLPGGGSRSLLESMPSACYRSDAGEYAARHNPQVYYVNLPAGECAQYNVPLSDPPDLSARFTFVVPNLMHDMHNGTVGDGDTWLSTFVPKVVSSPEYAAGRTAMFVTWDEDNLFSGNHIPTLVVAPSVAPGTRVTDRLDHYAMLRATQEMLGVEPLLGGAATAADLRTPFNV